MYTAVAIDGPAGAGKSTISRAVAKRLGFIYVDTGALYRTVALAAKRQEIKPVESKEIEEFLKTITVELSFDDNHTQIVLLNGENVSSLIRTPEISMMASAVSAIPCVRAFLLDLQRDMAKKHDVIMDGRDIATVVLPNAQVKIFLTAAADIRAKRRYDELVQNGTQVKYEDVLQDVKLRDNNDSNRKIAPLKPAEESVIVDTSNLSFEQSVERIISVIEEKK